MTSATFSSRKASGTVDDEIRSFDLDLWNSPVAVRRNLVVPNFQIVNQSSRESEEHLNQVDKSSEEGLNGDKPESIGNSEQESKEEGDRFLSPIMEELTEVPSDFYISTECTGGKKLQAQTMSPQINARTTDNARSSKRSDDLVLQEGQQKEESKVSTFTAQDEDELPLHSLPNDDKGSRKQLTLASEYPPHCSAQTKGNLVTETPCDSENTPEPKRPCDSENTPEPKRKAFATEVTLPDLGPNKNTNSPRNRTDKKIKQKESQYLHEGEQHCVWKPGGSRRSSLHHLPTERRPSSESPTKEIRATERHLLERKRSLDIQVFTAQEALRNKYSDNLATTSSPRTKFRAATKRVSSNLKAQKQKDQQVQFQDVAERTKHRKALYSAHFRDSKGSVKRLSPHSSPTTPRRNPSSTSHESTSDENKTFQRSTSSPVIFSGMGVGQTSRPHHVSPLTTPTMRASSCLKRRSSVAPYEGFLRRQTTTKLAHVSPAGNVVSPQRHHTQTVTTPAPSTNINPGSDPLPTQGFPNMGGTGNEKSARSASKIPLVSQRSFSPSKSNWVQLQHPLERYNTAFTPSSKQDDIDCAIGSTRAKIHGVPSAESAFLHQSESPSSAQRRKDFPKVSQTRKRSLSDSDICN